TNNNIADSAAVSLAVVNCFQNSVSLIPTTTRRAEKDRRERCELLSEFSIFDTNNNWMCVMP
ncbi:MAG: hypothetical protein PHY69_10265, partial [Dysgonamonadaceae bacterium]|nr:hypothetical protein [Dysgonamonadaceae bacterium]